MVRQIMYRNLLFLKVVDLSSVSEEFRRTHNFTVSVMVGVPLRRGLLGYCPIGSD